MKKLSDHGTIAAALDDFVRFLRDFGEQQGAMRMEGRKKRLGQEEVDAEVLLTIKNEGDRIFRKIREQVMQGRCLPNCDQQKSMERLKKAFRVLDSALYPEAFEGHEISIAQWPGSESVIAGSIGFVGRRSTVKDIFKSCVLLVLSFGRAIIDGQFEAAWRHLSLSMQARITTMALAKIYLRLDETFGGKPGSIVIERFGWILADDQARLNLELGKIWPKEIAPEERRCTLDVFWIRNPLTKAGNPETWWIVEEDGLYRIANVLDNRD